MAGFAKFSNHSNITIRLTKNGKIDVKSILQKLCSQKNGRTTNTTTFLLQKILMKHVYHYYQKDQKIGNIVIRKAINCARRIFGRERKYVMRALKITTHCTIKGKFCCS